MGADGEEALKKKAAEEKAKRETDSQEELAPPDRCEDIIEDIIKGITKYHLIMDIPKYL